MSQLSSLSKTFHQTEPYYRDREADLPVYTFIDTQSSNNIAAMGNAGRKRGRVADDVKPNKGKKPRLAKPPAAAKSNKKLKTQPSDSKESLEPNTDKRTCIVAELSNAGHNNSTTTIDVAQNAFQQTNDGANRIRTVNPTEKPGQEEEEEEEEEEEDDDEVTGKDITLSQMWGMASAMPANPIGVRRFTEEEQGQIMAEYVRILETVPPRLRDRVRNIWMLKLLRDAFGKEATKGLTAFAQNIVAGDAAAKTKKSNTPAFS